MMTEWISMEDHLPPETGCVLMTDGKRMYISSRNALFKNSAGLHEIPANFGSGAVVTHWLPLPPPPADIGPDTDDSRLGAGLLEE